MSSGNPMVAADRILKDRELSVEKLKELVRQVEAFTCADSANHPPLAALAQESTIYTSGSMEHKCLLHAAASAQFKLRGYSKARAYATALCELAPDEKLFVELLQDIEGSIREDGQIGLAIIGGIMVGAAAIGLRLLRR